MNARPCTCAPRSRATRRGRSIAVRRHRPTASWKRSDSAGGSRVKRVRSPADRASSTSVSSCTPSVSSSRVRPGSAARTRAWATVGTQRLGSAEADGEIAPAGRRAQALELAVQHHAPVIDDDDVLADVLDEVELMAGEQHRRAVARQVADHLRERLDAERIEPGERLVEHERHRIVHERRGELHPLLVAVRERVQPRLAALLEPQPRQPAVDAVGGGAAIQPRQSREVLELRPHPHVRIEAALLGHVAEAQTCLAVDRRAGPADLTRVGFDEAEDAAHRRRLARAVRAQQADDAPRAHRQAAAVERGDVAVALAQAGDLQPEAASAERRPSVLGRNDRHVSSFRHSVPAAAPPGIGGVPYSCDVDSRRCGAVRRARSGRRAAGGRAASAATTPSSRAAAARGAERRSGNEQVGADADGGDHRRLARLVGDRARGPVPATAASAAYLSLDAAAVDQRASPPPPTASAELLPAGTRACIAAPAGSRSSPPRPTRRPATRPRGSPAAAATGRRRDHLPQHHRGDQPSRLPASPRSRRVVLTTVVEHHANLLPWSRLARCRYVECDADGTFDVDAVDRGAGRRDRAPGCSAITGASNVTGWVAADRRHHRRGPRARRARARRRRPARAAPAAAHQRRLRGLERPQDVRAVRRRRPHRTPRRLRDRRPVPRRWRRRRPRRPRRGRLDRPAGARGGGLAQRARRGHTRLGDAALSDGGARKGGSVSALTTNGPRTEVPVKPTGYVAEAPSQEGMGWILFAGIMFADRRDPQHHLGDRRRRGSRLLRRRRRLHPHRRPDHLGLDRIGVRRARVPCRALRRSGCGGTFGRWSASLSRAGRRARAHVAARLPRSGHVRSGGDQGFVISRWPSTAASPS